MRHRLPTAILLSLVLVAASFGGDPARANEATVPLPAPAADPAMAAAREHFEAGRAAFNRGDFANAIRQFKAASALRPAPTLSYNIGLANERLGRRHVALQYYQRYLQAAPTAPNRVEVEGRIAQLGRELAAQAPGPPAPADSAQPAPAPSVPSR